mmetsp:Transcript_12866/g.34654  ORF Transcript_12866/g.34654 Transcript_12866/m.34654 type:complete len:173 (+) Transcript_12866:64-582(+)
MSGRLLKEYREIVREMGSSEDPEIVLRPRSEEDFGKWTGRIKGPAGTPYEGGSFVLDVVVPRAYPLHPPAVRFVTRLFHPNVHAKTGEICLDILKLAWSPAWTLYSTCRAIAVLLAHPEPESPLNCDAGNLLRAGDYRGYASLAKMYTELCAVRSPQQPEQQNVSAAALSPP